MQDPLKHSLELKQEADSILKDSDILSLLELYGTVNIIGSYNLDVLFRPDIDIFVVGKSHDYYLAKKVAHKLLDTDYFDMLCFVNKVGTSFENKIQGYYLQPHKNIGDRDWKMDVWLTTSDYFDNRNELLKKRFDDSANSVEIRKKIIILKNHFSEGSKYQGSIDGNKIYNVVLDNPTLSVEELSAKLTK